MKLFASFLMLYIFLSSFTKASDFFENIEYSIEHNTAKNHTTYCIQLHKKSTKEAHGSVIFTHNVFKHTAIIQTLCIKKEYRNRGYGSLLFKKAIDFLLKNNCPEITWKVFPYEINPRTPEFAYAEQRLVNFYKKLGGQVFYTAACNCICMRYNTLNNETV